MNKYSVRYTLVGGSVGGTKTVGIAAESEDAARKIINTRAREADLTIKIDSIRKVG